MEWSWKEGGGGSMRLPENGGLKEHLGQTRERANEIGSISLSSRMSSQLADAFLQCNGLKM